MTHAPLLETARLRLCAHTIETFEPFHAMWSDPEIVRYVTGTPARREESWMRLLRNLGLWPLLGYGSWAVHEKASGRYAGSVGFADFYRDIEPAILGVPEAGWMLASWAHGRGFAGEALAASLAWLDARTHPRSVCLIDPANLPSIRLAERHGYGACVTARFQGRDTLLLSRARP